jgi:antitoxin (DNA-binding transcriptional repressor) of toxin-antitoxin stability system
MKKITVRDLRYNFPKIENLLAEEQTLYLTKHDRVIARILPPEHTPTRASKMPDFMKRLKKIYGKKMLKTTNADLLRQDRDRY